MAKHSIDQFLDVIDYHDLSFSPDGQWVVHLSDESGQYNVWKRPVYPENGQKPVQLTHFTEEIARRVFWSKDHGQVITLADHQGSENYQVYSLGSEPGEQANLTSGQSRNEVGTPYSKTGRPFSPDGRYLAYSSNARDAANFDIVVRDLASGELRTVYSDGGRSFTMSWSPDGKKILMLQVPQNLDHNLYLIDVASGTHQHLTPHEGDVRCLPGPWLPDSSGFYVLTNHDREFDGLALFKLADNSIEWEATPDWDVIAADLSADGRYLAWIVNEDGYSHLFVRDEQTGTVRDYPDLPHGVYVDSKSLAYAIWFSPTEPVLGFYISTPNSPDNIYMLNVETGKLWPLTTTGPRGVSQDEMPLPELIRYPSTDGLEIPAWLYKPAGLAPGQRVPVILYIHGGPEAQEKPDYGWKGFHQYLLSRGIGSLATNIRGSTGYGRTYQGLIYHDWGGGDLRDFEHAAKYLQSLDWVDPDRLGVMGGSFGGFATLSCVTRIPQYWKAAVDIVGPSNLVTFARSVPASWRARMRRWVGDPETEADFLMERSPISYVENIQAALLVMQGAHDPRVVKAESDQMVARLQELGRTVEYMVFDDEGHGFAKHENLAKALRAAAAWFEKYLLDEQSA